MTERHGACGQSISDKVEACLARIRERDSGIHAWQHVDAAGARAAAQRLERQGSGGLLHGIPVGIKDIFETRDMPTGWGTDYLVCEHAPRDAAAVAMLRRAGAIVLGKTVSTEFAYFGPPSTRNPHDPERTPGASSSGSAAAVADGMVPLALGTQTAGSIIRPASYCGVLGFKPSHGVFPLAGASAFSPSLDTLGWFARRVEDIALAYGALLGVPPPDLGRCEAGDLRIGVAHVPASAKLTADGQGALEYAAALLRERGAHVHYPDFPATVHDLATMHADIMAFEAARTLADVHDRFAERMTAQLRDLLERGLRITEGEYLACRREVQRQSDALAGQFGDRDLLLVPSAAGVAPPVAEGTGDPIYSRIWTALGFPSISLPLGCGQRGLPVGVQLVAPKFRDAFLLAAAYRIMRYAAATD